MIEIKQASDAYIIINAKINGEPVTAVQNAKYVVFDRQDNILLEKSLGSGVTFTSPGRFVIHLTDQDTNLLGPGRFQHECVILDTQNNDSFILKENFKITKTIARI